VNLLYIAAESGGRRTIYARTHTKPLRMGDAFPIRKNRYRMEVDLDTKSASSASTMDAKLSRARAVTDAEPASQAARILET
jgi:hypothetical protein